MSHRDGPHRKLTKCRRTTGSTGAPAPLIVELAANAPATVIASAEAAAAAVAHLTAVELVHVPERPGGEELRIRGPLVALDAPLSVARRQYKAMVAFAAAFESARLVADDDGGRSINAVLRAARAESSRLGGIR